MERCIKCKRPRFCIGGICQDCLMSVPSKSEFKRLAVLSKDEQIQSLQSQVTKLEEENERLRKVADQAIEFAEITLEGYIPHPMTCRENEVGAGTWQTKYRELSEYRLKESPKC